MLLLLFLSYFSFKSTNGSNFDELRWIWRIFSILSSCGIFWLLYYRKLNMKYFCLILKYLVSYLASKFYSSCYLALMFYFIFLLQRIAEWVQEIFVYFWKVYICAEFLESLNILLLFLLIIYYLIVFTLNWFTVIIFIIHFFIIFII